MSKLIEKARELVKSIEKNEMVEFGIELETGLLSVNGITFSLAEQVELVNLHDSSLADLINKITQEPTSHAPSAPKDPKDAEIERLKAEIAELKNDRGIQFPDDFEFVEIPLEVSDVEDEEIQKIITEMENTPISEGEFVIQRTKDIAVIKISDSEGISYLVTEGYYFANKK